MRLEKFVAGYVSIKDLLKVDREMVIGNYVLDAIINVTVIQYSTSEFQVDFLEIENDEILLKINDENRWVLLNWYNTGESLLPLREAVKKEIVRLAIETAKNIPEENWHYYNSEY